jgi:hypothetical protein
MPGPDPGHWLYRLTAAEWLAAARTELAHAEAALSRREARPGITHARRAAGMAWNALLATTPDDRFGRSYMDHLNAAATAVDLPDAVRAAAKLLVETPPRPPELVTLGKPDMAPAEAARTILDHAARLAAP